MLIEFDQSTVANMTAALDYIIKQIPAEKDSHETRKRIADAMTESAKAGGCSYADFQSTGQQALDQIVRSSRSNLPGFGWLSVATSWLR